MSATRLLVLGVVRAYQKAHGYQVRRELMSWSADRWANIRPDSIYHALKQLAAEGLLVLKLPIAPKFVCGIEGAPVVTDEAFPLVVR